MIRINTQIVKSIINEIIVYIIHLIHILIFFIISALSGSLINVEALAGDTVVKSIKNIRNTGVLQQDISNQNTSPNIEGNINATNATGTKTSAVNIENSSETIAKNIVAKPKITADTDINAIESNMPSAALTPNNQHIKLIQSNQSTYLIQQEQQKQQKQEKQKESNEIAVQDVPDATTNKANNTNSPNKQNGVNHTSTASNEKNTIILEEVNGSSKNKENIKKRSPKKSARKNHAHKSNNIHGKGQRDRQKERKDKSEVSDVDLTTNSDHDSATSTDIDVDTNTGTTTKINRDNSAHTLEDAADIQQPIDIPKFSDFLIKQPINGITFADNEQIKIVLSNRDINRISVIDDKIQSINGPAGFYTAKNDLSGSAYLGINTDTRFTLFASTVKGHQISLLITPRHTPGKAIVLNPISLPLRSSPHAGVIESYQKLMVTLISGMINNEALSNYTYIPAKKAKSYDLYKMVTIQPLGYYMGSNLVGVVSEIRNKTNQPITIKPSNFYNQIEIRAIALSEETLTPKASGLLYQIYSK